jgi:subtilisin family serine protease
MDARVTATVNNAGVQIAAMVMRKRVFLLLSLTILSTSLLASTAVATDSDPLVTQDVETEMETSSEPVEVLVTFEDTGAGGLSIMEDRKREVERSQRALVRYAESTDGVRVLNEFWISNAVLLEVEPGFRYEALLEFEGVRSVRSNTEIEVFSSSTTRSRAGAATGPVHEPIAQTTTQTHTQTQSASTYDYGVEQISAPDVWSQYGTKGGGVNVAVLDTGVNASHPDIDLRTTNSSDPTYPGGWAEFDSQGNRVSGSEPHDSEGHGTHVSGTVAGENTGVAPDANLMHGMVVNGRRGTLAQALSGMEWAIQNDADVISMSFGGNKEDVWIGAVENANEMGVVVVAAVGNGGDGTSASPGNIYDAVSVGAVDSDLDVAGFSSGEVIDTDETWGDSALSDWPEEYVVPDIVAAGVGVNSTSADGGYTQLSGTSMATPHVAGAVALVESSSGGGNVGEMSNAFRLTAYGSGSDDPGTRYGYGAADALAATEFVQDDATVSGTVVNGSGAPVNEAELRVNNVYVDTSSGDYSVELAEGSWEFEATAPGYNDKTETVSLAKDENAARDIVMEEIEPAFFEVSNLNGPAEAETGESVTVKAKIKNTGNLSGTQNVTLRLNESGEPLNEDAVIGVETEKLGGGEEVTVEFENLSVDKAGKHDYAVFTEDDKLRATLTVEERTLFTTSLVSSFENSPRNIPVSEGGLDDGLYEDLDGDGDVTDVGPTVDVFGELIRGNDLGLTDEQARAFNWYPSSPETEVTVADMVELFGEQIRD